MSSHGLSLPRCPLTAFICLLPCPLTVFHLPFTTVAAVSPPERFWAFMSSSLQGVKRTTASFAVEPAGVGETGRADEEEGEDGVEDGDGERNGGWDFAGFVCYMEVDLAEHGAAWPAVGMGAMGIHAIAHEERHCHGRKVSNTARKVSNTTRKGIEMEGKSATQQGKVATQQGQAPRCHGPPSALLLVCRGGGDRHSAG